MAITYPKYFPIDRINGHTIITRAASSNQAFTSINDVSIQVAGIAPD